MTMIAGQKMKVGKTHQINHRRKGEWQAKCIANDGVWVTLDDDPTIAGSRRVHHGL